MIFASYHGIKYGKYGVFSGNSLISIELICHRCYYTGMSLYDYHVFNTVVQQGSFNRASRLLHVTPSAVSHIIAKVEGDFGFPLLHRNRNGVSLTPDGAKILPSIQEILRCNEQLNQEIAELNHVAGGSVRIAAFSSVATAWLPDILKSFKDSFPNVSVSVLQGSYGEVAQWLESDAVDLAFLTGVYKESEDTEMIKIASDRLMCVLPPDFKTGKRKKISLSDIKGLPFIHSSSGSDNEIWKYTEENKLSSDYEFIFDDDNAKLSMVEKGLGYCVVPELVLHNNKYNVKTLQADPCESRDIFLAVAHARFMAPATLEMKKHILGFFENI